MQTNPIDWPTDLPNCFMINSYSRVANSQTIRSETDGPLPKIRRRYTKSIINISGVMVFTKAQVLRLDQFFNNDLAAGVLSFMFTDPIDGPGVYRFRDVYSISAITAEKFQVSIDLERLP